MMKKGLKNIVLLALSIIVLGNVIAPMEVSATEAGTTDSSGKAIVTDAILYQAYTVNEMETFFGQTAPTKDGYYFGGWYGSPDETYAIKYQNQVDEMADEDTVYAKFVPAYMLSVKVQNSADIKLKHDNGTSWEDGFIQNNSNLFDSTNRTKIRMISSVDSTRYKEVGFHLFVGGNRSWARVQSEYNKTVYSKLNAVNSDGTKTSYTAKDLFGLASAEYDPKLVVANFSNIPEMGWKTSIFVRPYWITFDGIEVRGTGRYIHVEDGIKGYVTVPVNLQGLDDATGVVAGTLDVEYDSTKLEYIDTIASSGEGTYKDDAYKAGADLNKAIAKEKSTRGTVKCAAIRKNSSTNLIKNINPNEYASVKRSTVKEETTVAEVDTYEAVNNIYIVLRFKPTETYRTTGGFLEFNISNISFCDTVEKPVSVNIWNVRY